MEASQTMKKLAAALLAATLLALPVQAAEAAPAAAGAPTVDAAGAVLMEKETGTVLYEQNAHDKLEPASVTKVMTLLLVMEAIDSGSLSRDDLVTVSAYAASMGGSQVYLKEGEQMTVNDLLKAVAVASGNDASVALAEHLAGSEEAFVERMNQRAAELGMADTCFVNCTGLPAAGHLTSAYDIALMSRELILNHPAIREYTTIWMDTLRNGQFQLANTNKLIRFYEGATGLKTGSTDSAGYCLSATAERDGMELIAVILKSPTKDTRTAAATSLLNYGFSNYTLMDVYPSQALPPVDVLLGESDTVQPVLSTSSRILVEKSMVNQVTTQVSLCENVEAPVEAGQKLGEMAVYQGEELGMTNANFTSLDQYRDVESLNHFQILRDKGMSEESVYNILKVHSRDNSRTPMQWDATAQGGFTTGEPWISVNPNTATINAQAQVEDKDSIFAHYQALIRLRHTYDVFAQGDFTPLTPDHPAVLAYQRKYQGQELICVSNFYRKECVWKAPVALDGYRVLLSNYSDSEPKAQWTLRPYESVIFQLSHP